MKPVVVHGTACFALSARIRLSCNDTVLDCETRRFGPVSASGFAQDVFYVSMDRSNTDTKLGGNLLIERSLRNVPQHLNFPRCEIGDDTGLPDRASLTDATAVARCDLHDEAFEERQPLLPSERETIGQDGHAVAALPAFTKGELRIGVEDAGGEVQRALTTQGVETV